MVGVTPLQGTKLLVPLVLFALGRYRDPRAGIAIGLASGFGFLALLRWVLLVVMYLTFRAWARKSTPPQLVGEVSRGWDPKQLPSERSHR